MVASKAELLNRLLDEHIEVTVAFSVDFDGIDVHPSIEPAEGSVALRIGRNVTPAIPDLDVTEQHLVATLRFNGGDCYRCIVPMDAIWLMEPSDDRQHTVFFPQSAPAYILRQVVSGFVRAGNSGPLAIEPQGKLATVLRLVKGEGDGKTN